jgi:hypothetical protein
MFNDKLLEYRENGDLERLSRQVGLQNISELCLNCNLEKASA